MATSGHVIPPMAFTEDEPTRLVSHRVTRYLVPLGRGLFAALFIMAAPMHFTAWGTALAAAEAVPMAEVLVPTSGVLALLGGLSVAVGYQARLGGFLLTLFLVPVTLLMHAYWQVVDPAAAMVQQVMFWKNVSLLGAALVFTHFGAGPISIDALTYKARTEHAERALPR
jgi:putative oxidoreductase